MQPLPAYANADLAAVRPYCLPSDRETQAKAGSIAPAALAKHLKQIAFARRNAAAFVLDLEEQLLMFGAHPEYHASS
jgi:hypothetical protein